MATKQIIWTTKAIDEVNEQINMGFYPKGDMNPFFEGTPGFRKPGLAFKMTQNELEEYIKCKMDIHYFSENYCYVKGDQGEPIKLKLRDYQKEVLDNFFNNRFNILMASRQVGKCLGFNELVEIEVGDNIVFIKIGKLYYDTLKEIKGLTLLQRVKIFLYDFLSKLEN
jgi:hypothetical protein